MAKTKAELLHDIKILKHNYEAKHEQCERVMIVNGYLSELLKEKGVSDKEINEFIMMKDKHHLELMVDKDVLDDIYQLDEFNGFMKKRIANYFSDINKRCVLLEKALDKVLYKWITHEQPNLVRGVGNGFDVSVKKAIELNKSVIFKEVQDE